MKRFSAFLAAGLMLSLTGCLGGGSGGGATASLPALGDGVGFEKAELSGSFGSAVSGYTTEQEEGGTLAGPWNSPDGMKNGSVKFGDAIEVTKFDKYEDAGILVGEASFNGNIDNMKKFREDILQNIQTYLYTEYNVGKNDINKNFEDDDIDFAFSGDITYDNVVVFLKGTGGKVDLKYSTYGLWALNLIYDGVWTYKDGRSVSGSSHDSFIQPFFGGNDSNKAASVESGASFNGDAMGILMANRVSGENRPKVYGNATLLMTGTDKANLVLDFRKDNFYEFTFTNVDIRGGEITGHFTDSGYKDSDGDRYSATRVEITGGNTTRPGYQMKGRLRQPYLNGFGDGLEDNTFLQGQFYGNGSAEEAAGKFGIFDENDTGIYGGFGVKK